MKITLLSYTPDPEKVVASAAKLCYSPSTIEQIMDGLTDENIEKFITRLSSYGHHSPFEHVSFTFGVEGVSRSLTHQLVRHRIASYSQQSQRYVKADQFEYVVPSAILEDAASSIIFKDTMDMIQKSYDDIVDSLMFKQIEEYHNIHTGITVTQTVVDNFKHYYPKVHSKFEKIAIENARAVLPNATETKIVVTMNARSLINFFSERTCRRAQDEIRAMSLGMLKICKEVAPNLFKNAGASCMYGKCKEGSMCCGSPYPKN